MFDDSKYVSAQEAYSVYQSVRLAMSGKYDVVKYGVYNNRFKKKFEKVPQRLLFEKLANRYQTEYRLVTAVASNLIIDTNIFVTDFDDENYYRLRRYNTSLHEFNGQAKNLFVKYNVRDLIVNGQLLQLFITGEVSPELFCSLYQIYDLDSSLNKTEHAYVWNLIKPRVDAYTIFVNPSNQRTIIASLASILKHKNSIYKEIICH
ncbi:MAG: hypothetical protein KGI54_14880 [Pseudomonadota bacterium]|nr:hypothetical protein [Pseudomonadota bacterium]